MSTSRWIMCRAFWSLSYFLTAVSSAGAAAGNAAGSAGEDAVVPPGVRVHRYLQHGCIGDRKLVLDLYLPETGEQPVPLIIWVHGGGWAAGSKDQVGAEPDATRLCGGQRRLSTQRRGDFSRAD